jgi:hypothetical protein
MKKLLLILLPLSFSVFAANNKLCIMGGWDKVNFKIKGIDGKVGYKVTEGKKFDGVENLDANCFNVKADRKNSPEVMQWAAKMHMKLNNGQSFTPNDTLTGAHVAALGSKNFGHTLPNEANFAFVGTMTLRKDNLRLTCPNLLIAQTGDYSPKLYTQHNTWFIFYDENLYTNSEEPQINCSDDNGNLVKLKMTPGNNVDKCGGRLGKIVSDEDAADSGTYKALKALSNEEDTAQNSDDEEFSAQSCGVLPANEIKMTIVK